MHRARLVTALFLLSSFAGGIAGAQDVRLPEQSVDNPQKTQSDERATETAPVGPPPGSHAAPANTKIGPDDSITIVSLASDEINKTWRVGSTGDLNLPLIGKIHVAGLTAEQLEAKLIGAMKKYYKDPDATVYISDFQSQPVEIAGAVHRPGSYQLAGSKTLLAALMLTGGPDAAGPTLIVSRPVQNGEIPLAGDHLDPTGDRYSVDLNLSDVLDPTTRASNLEMRPGDVVSVSSKQRLVFIIGEVAKPGAVELVTQNSVSVMQVLAAAGGLTKVSAAGHSEILHQDQNGLYKRVASVDLKGMLNGKAEDRLLSAGDIVFVPSSNLKTYGQAAITGVMATGIYVILNRF
jgi:polysaccharide export outer membrane protein